MKNNNIICILGMHRSGTSMLTRVLNIWGLHLGGKKEMFKPLYHNPKGHWENTKFMEININVIKILSNNSKKSEDWNTVITFPKNWERLKKICQLKNKALSLINEFDSNYPIWGWKDPRNCITLPFWQSILKNRLKYIVVLRQPIDIASSLYKRNKYPMLYGLSLWSQYLTKAIGYTSNHSRYFIATEQILENQNEEIRQLIDFVDDKNVVFNDESMREIKKFIDKDIWHNQKHKRFLNINQKNIVRTLSQMYNQAIHETIRLSRNTTE